MISDPDSDTRTGTCSVCGPVKLYGGNGYPWRCSNKVRAQQSRDRREDPVRARERKWQSNGIQDFTVAQYEAMLAAQRGLCALCQEHMKKVQVDHCHDTGKVRGLLCSTCNTGLGKFGDDPDRLEAAARYLRAARTLGVDLSRTTHGVIGGGAGQG